MWNTLGSNRGVLVGSRARVFCDIFVFSRKMHLMVFIWHYRESVINQVADIDKIFPYLICIVCKRRHMITFVKLHMA
jgi:hypothetical protein